MEVDANWEVCRVCSENGNVYRLYATIMKPIVEDRATTKRERQCLVSRQQFRRKDVEDQVNT